MPVNCKSTPATARDRPAKQVAAAVALALGGVPAAFAADAPDALEELVVTASRREQTLIEVPYNISAVSGQSLRAAGITSLTDIARVLPGINVPDLGPRASSSNSNIVIRGLNANDPGGSGYLPWESVPLVSTYVDEVPLFVNLALFDVQRVEVLRGPQGTLYGSGAVAGTIKVIHNAPDPKAFAADFAVDGSSTSHASNASYSTNGMLNIPLGDSAALRANAGYRSVSGFINASNAVLFDKTYQPVLADPSNPLTSNFATHSLRNIDSAISTYARAEILWHINGKIDASLAYQRQDDHSNAFSRESQGKSYTDGVYIPLAPDHRIINLYALTVSGDLGFATVTSSTSFTDNGDQSGYDQSPFLLQFNANPVTYGSYPRPTTEFFTDYKDKSFVEELRLVSRESATWDYTVGGFFRREINDLFQFETIPGFAAWSELPGSANAVNKVTGKNYANFGDYVQFYNGGTRPSALAPTDTNYTYARNSGFTDRAVYGELTRHMTPQWQVTAGLRLFWQDVSQTLYQTIPYGGPSFSTLPPPKGGPGGTDKLGTTINAGDKKFHNHLLKLNTGYAITPTLRTYATYSEGFRHGGTNASAIGTCLFCDSPSTASFQPDTVKNYEAGLKGTAGDWLRFSGDIYRMRWSDIQIQLFDYSGSAYVANGGTAVSQGVELELEGQLGQGWSAMFGFGYSDAKVTGDFQIIDRPDIAGNPPILNAHDGDRLPYVPRQTLTAGVSYTHSLTHELALDLHADASYRSGVTTQINASAAGYQQLGGFTTMAASATLHFGSSWRTRLFVNNLTDTAGISAAGPVLRNADSFAPNYRENYVLRPRTIGLSIEYNLR